MSVPFKGWRQHARNSVLSLTLCRHWWLRHYEQQLGDSSVPAVNQIPHSLRSLLGEPSKLCVRMVMDVCIDKKKLQKEFYLESPVVIIQQSRHFKLLSRDRASVIILLDELELKEAFSRPALTS